MSTTAITQHDLQLLKTQVGAHGIWPAAWDRGQWVEREDTMVFLVEGKARVFMSKEDFEPFVKAVATKTRHR